MENISMDLNLASFAENLSFLIWAGKFGMTKVKLFICFILSNVMHTETNLVNLWKKTLDSWEKLKSLLELTFPDGKKWTCGWIYQDTKRM